MSDFYDCSEGPSVEKEVDKPLNEDNEILIVEEAPFHSKVHITEGTEQVVYDLIDAGLEKDLQKALKAKEEGNQYFRKQDYSNACQFYSLAIDHCPVNNRRGAIDIDSDKKEDSTDVIEVEEDYSEHLATFYGNRSAAYFAMEDYELVIDDCTAALEYKPDYVKVLYRRMQSYEKLGKVEEALKDAKTIQEKDPKFPNINKTVDKLQKEYDEKMNKLKDEALGKLKQLGNSILGNFGMSLDNFKMQQDPTTGSWSVSMNNGK